MHSDLLKDSKDTPL